VTRLVVVRNGVRGTNRRTAATKNEQVLIIKALGSGCASVLEVVDWCLVLDCCAVQIVCAETGGKGVGLSPSTLRAQVVRACLGLFAVYRYIGPPEPKGSISYTKIAMMIRKLKIIPKFEALSLPFFLPQTANDLVWMQNM
jgi:hypothetical protein